MKQLALWTIYGIGHVATFIFLTFFDGHHYNWWNWMLIVPINEFQATIWFIYWPLVRPFFG